MIIGPDGPLKKRGDLTTPLLQADELCPELKSHMASLGKTETL